MLDLFPDIRPYDEGRLDVGDGHTLYYEQCGDPDGVPVLVLHGGPGAGCQPVQRRFFDPRHFRIILLDQRGAGRSTPHADLRENHTAKLIADIETLRQHLGVTQWLLFGGSFGATLALLYARQYPQHSSALILRGIFLARRQDIAWYFGGGVAQIYPDAWTELLRHLPDGERHEPLAAFHRRLTGSDEIARAGAARAWNQYAARIRSLHDNNHQREQYHDAHRALSIARIACHYAQHDYFLAGNDVLDAAQALGDLPGILVHGRYDIVSPLAAAWEVQRRWQGSELRIVRGSGHVSTEPATVDALIRAVRDMHRLITGMAPETA